MHAELAIFEAVRKANLTEAESQRWFISVVFAGLAALALIQKLL